MLGRSEKSLLLIGLRGVGKTVLLNEMRHRAETTGYHTVKIEAMEGEPLGSLLVQKIRNLLYDLNRLTEKEHLMPPLLSQRLVKILAPLVCLSLLVASAISAQTDREVPHLEAARQLVRDLQRDALINQYGSDPTFLRWDHPTREARTVCGSFVTKLLEHAYGWNESDIKQWLGAGGTDATEWHEAIVNENGFRRFHKIGDVRPGDLLAIKYNDDSKDTGHVMVVDHEPERIEPCPPIEQGTEQYRVEVIDSSASGHGPADTRHKPDGGFTGGIGRGAIRLYADQDGRIVGYAWSETPKSTFYQSPQRDLACGHLTRE